MVFEEIVTVLVQKGAKIKEIHEDTVKLQLNGYDILVVKEPNTTEVQFNSVLRYSSNQSYDLSIKADIPSDSSFKEFLNDLPRILSVAKIFEQ